MGYMGLDYVGESDSAADLESTVHDAIAKELKKGLKDKGNCYNTDGYTNVALIAESMFKDSALYSDGDLIKVIKDTLVGVERNLTEALHNTEDWKHRDMHVKAYGRLRRSLRKIIGNAY